MSLRSQLYHTCVIQRAGDKKVATFIRDRFGSERPTNVTDDALWVNIQTDLKCRLMTRSESRAQPTLSDQIETEFLLVIPANTDVTTKDRVKSVTFEDESTIGPFDIEEVIPRRDGRSQRLIALGLDIID